MVFLPLCKIIFKKVWIPLFFYELIMGLFSWEELSESEKIDFIYKKLRSQQRLSQIKLVTVIITIICLYFVIQFLAKPESEPVRNKAIAFAQQKIATFVSPIVSGILDSVMADMMNKVSVPSSINDNSGDISLKGENLSGQNNSDISLQSGNSENIPIKTENVSPSQAIGSNELPTVHWIKITPEMLDAVHNSVNK